MIQLQNRHDFEEEVHHKKNPQCLLEALRILEMFSPIGEKQNDLMLNPYVIKLVNLTG